MVAPTVCIEGKHYKTIPLTQGQSAIVSHIDYKWLMQWKWWAVKTAKGYSAVRVVHTGPKKRFTLRMPSAIMEHAHGKFSIDIDHANGNPLDNRRLNLRFATRMQQCQNRGVPQGNTSKYKGVHLHRGKWLARIGHNRRRITLGWFADREDAAKAYNQAALKLHGRFARLNVISCDT
jgi:hypothetical protein